MISRFKHLALEQKNSASAENEILFKLLIISTHRFKKYFVFNSHLSSFEQPITESTLLDNSLATLI